MIPIRFRLFSRRQLLRVIDLSESNWIVLKFGGTSVTGRAQWETIARLASERQSAGHRVLLVCSAMAGTTDALNSIADANDGGHGGAIMELVQRHGELATALEVDARDILEEATRQLAAHAAAYAESGKPQDRAKLMAVGEWISTQIGCRFLSGKLPCHWVDSRDALEAIAEDDPDSRRAFLSAQCRPGPDQALRESWEAIGGVLIAPGFVARTSNGRTALLGRGGSDTSAALLAGRLGAGSVEIWTDVPGLFSADPRLIPDARLIHRLEMGEALEMAASGARVVDPRCLHAASVTGTTVRVRETNRPEHQGTLIEPHGQRDEPGGIKAVTLQKDMAVLLLENRDIRQQVGFLADIFSEIGRQGISVDLVATSETTTTLAVHKPSNHLDDGTLARLVDALKVRSRVTVQPEACTINLVGQGVRNALAHMSVLGDWLQENPLLMVSQSANDRCLSLLVRAESAEGMLRTLHTALVEPGDGPQFGPRWSEFAGL